VLQCAAVCCSVLHCVAVCCICGAHVCDPAFPLSIWSQQLLCMAAGDSTCGRNKHTSMAATHLLYGCNRWAPCLRSNFSSSLSPGVLQCVAVCCSVLQCVAACCKVWQCVVVCCGVLYCVAVCCIVLHCVAVRCSALQCVAVRCSVLQYVAVWCSMLQCGLLCCSVLQYVTIALQCVAVV